MEPHELDPAKYVEILMQAFPVAEDAIQLEHAGTTMISTFKVCRLCGALVLESMSTTHVHEVHIRNANFN